MPSAFWCGRDRAKATPEQSRHFVEGARPATSCRALDRQLRAGRSTGTFEEPRDRHLRGGRSTGNFVEVA